MMATAFMGYALPWGQMSFWGATVITNLFSPSPSSATRSPPGCGRLSVDNPTLNRFFSLHYLLPFVIAGVVGLHIWALHGRPEQSGRRRHQGTVEGHDAVHAVLHDEGQRSASSAS